MSDFVQIGPNKFATDELPDGTQIQRVKIQHGVDGSAVDASSTDPLPVDVTFPAVLYTDRPTATVVSVTNYSIGSGSPVTILSADPARKHFTIYTANNDFPFVKFGTGASTASYSFELGRTFRLWEPSYPYDGIITAICASTQSATIRVTQFY